MHGYIEAPLASAPSPQVIIQKAHFTPAQYGKIKSKSEFAGTGCLVQGLGLLLMISGIFTYGIGFIVGLVLLIAGGRMAIKLICSECGNPIVNKKVKICPACKAHFR